MSTYCPACEDALEEGAVLCVSCGYHLEKGTHLETNAREPVEPVPRPDVRKSFLQPIGQRFVQWLLYGAVFTTPLVFLTFVTGYFLSNDSPGVEGFFTGLIAVVAVSAILALVIGITGAAARTFSLLTSDSPLIFWSIAAIIGLTLLVFLMSVGWEWFWNWALQSAERQRSL